MFQIDEFTCGRVIGMIESNRCRPMLLKLFLSPINIFKEVETRISKENASKCTVEDCPRMKKIR